VGPVFIHGPNPKEICKEAKVLLFVQSIHTYKQTNKQNTYDIHLWLTSWNKYYVTNNHKQLTISFP